MKKYKLVLGTVFLSVSMGILTGCNSGSDNVVNVANKALFNSEELIKANYSQGKREFFILNGIVHGESKSLFYKSSGSNSGVAGTIFPANGVGEALIEKPIVGQLVTSTMWQFEQSDKVDFNNEVRNLLISTFGDEVIGMYKSSIVEYNKNPNIKMCLNDFNSDKISGKTKDWELLCRFGNLESMKISAALGGGFWSNVTYGSFTSWFYEYYKNDILAYREEITTLPQPPQTINIPTIDDLVDKLPVSEYQRNHSVAEMNFQKILDTEFGLDESDLQEEL